MYVRDIMVTDVVTVHKNDTYEDVVKRLHESSLNGCPVIDDDGSVVGIVSHKDLLRILFPYYDSYYRSPELYTDFADRESKANEIRNHRIETFMSSPVFSIRPDVPILHAAGMMLAHHVQRLPVIENGILVGMVNRNHILREVFRKNFEL